MVLAPGITGKDLNPDLLPLKIGRGSATGNLLIVFTTQLDAESRYLTVNKSQFGLYLDDERKRMLLHYDYNRDPTNQYPDAHVQVAGGSRTLTRWCKRSGCTSKELPRLHLPVGGRRFRPTLEDVIEFLIIEELARPRDGWEKVIQRHRQRWSERQVKAVVRRDPISAIAALTDAGWTISRKDPPQQRG